MGGASAARVAPLLHPVRSDLVADEERAQEEPDEDHRESYVEDQLRRVRFLLLQQRGPVIFPFYKYSSVR